MGDPFNRRLSSSPPVLLLDFHSLSSNLLHCSRSAPCLSTFFIAGDRSFKRAKYHGYLPNSTQPHRQLCFPAISESVSTNISTSVWRTPLTNPHLLFRSPLNNGQRGGKGKTDSSMPHTPIQKQNTDWSDVLNGPQSQYPFPTWDSPFESSQVSLVVRPCTVPSI